MVLMLDTIYTCHRFWTSRMRILFVNTHKSQEGGAIRCTCKNSSEVRKGMAGMADDIDKYVIIDRLILCMNGNNMLNHPFYYIANDMVICAPKNQV